MSTTTTKSNNRRLIVSAVAVIHIVSHFAISTMDYTHLLPLMNFVRRPDGSQSDPNDLLPLEVIYTFCNAMAFGIVGLAFLLAFAFGPVATGISMRGAATLSIFFHGLWVVHMVWRWNVWRANMHPDGIVSPQNFFISHTVWTVLAGIVWMLPDDDDNVSKSAPVNKKPKAS